MLAGGRLELPKKCLGGFQLFLSFEAISMNFFMNIILVGSNQLLLAYRQLPVMARPIAIIKSCKVAEQP